MFSLDDHLESRWFRQSLYVCYPDRDSSCLTLPLWNLSGQMVGYQVYSPLLSKERDKANPRNMRYFTYASEGQVCVWGLETLRYDLPLYLTEGVFDACRLHWYGLPAVALLTNNAVHLRGWLRCLPVKKVACVQGDKAGMALAKFGDSCVYLPTGEDVGSLSDGDFSKLFLGVA